MWLIAASPDVWIKHHVINRFPPAKWLMTQHDWPLLPANQTTKCSFTWLVASLPPSQSDDGVRCRQQDGAGWDESKDGEHPKTQSVDDHRGELPVVAQLLVFGVLAQLPRQILNLFEDVDEKTALWRTAAVGRPDERRDSTRSVDGRQVASDPRRRPDGRTYAADAASLRTRSVELSDESSTTTSTTSTTSALRVVAGVVISRWHVHRVILNKTSDQF